MNIASVEAQGQGVRPTDVTEFKGQNVMFNCSGTQVTWFLTTAKIFKSPDNWFKPQGNKYETLGNYNLLVKNLDPDTDGGIYQCDTDENDNLLAANLVILGNILFMFIIVLSLVSHQSSGHFCSVFCRSIVRV